MSNIILWILFGALVGWIASILTGTAEKQGGLANIAVGIVGAMIGGFLARAIGSQGITGFNLTSFFVALIGAIILLGLVNLFSHE